MKELKRRRHQNEIGIWKTTNQLDEGNRLVMLLLMFSTLEYNAFQAVDLARKCEILDRENAAKSNSLKGARRYGRMNEMHHLPGVVFRDYNRAEKEVSEQERFSEQMSRQLLDIKAEVIFAVVVVRLFHILRSSVLSLIYCPLGSSSAWLKPRRIA